MESVLDVYKTPYDKKNPVVRMDESPKQLIKQTRIPIARKPGQDTKEDYEYSRKGVVNIFMANEPLKGKRYIRIKSSKTKKDWQQSRNTKKAKINWQFRTDDARVKLKRLYPTISS